MTIIAGPNYLTQAGTHDALAQVTHAGQAHFGIPYSQKTCRECALGRDAKRLKYMTCIKGTGVQFPKDAFSCKYFEAKPV